MDPENGILPVGEQLKGHSLGFVCSFPKGKGTDPGSALPAGPARAAGGTGICSTATIGTRIISRSGAGSMSGIGTGTETGTGTTETGGRFGNALGRVRDKGRALRPLLSSLLAGIRQEVVFNGLLSPHLDQDTVPEAAPPHPGPFPATPSPLWVGPPPAPRGLGNPPHHCCCFPGPSRSAPWILGPKEKWCFYSMEGGL